MDTERVSDERLALLLSDYCGEGRERDLMSINDEEIGTLLQELQSRRAAPPAGEVERLREALEPFAKIELSTLWSDADNEKYTAIVCGNLKPDFGRADVLKARAALNIQGE